MRLASREDPPALLGGAPVLCISSALLGGDGVKRRQPLFDFVAAAIGASDSPLFIFLEGQGFQEGLGTGVAEEFVCGHTASTRYGEHTPNRERQQLTVSGAVWIERTSRATSPSPIRG